MTAATALAEMTNGAETLISEGYIGVYLNPTDEEPIATLQLDQPAMSASTVTLTPKKRTKGQNMAEEALGFSGSVVLKAKTAAEVKALAAQLDWYAAFEEPFHNRYDGGYAAKGKVRAVALEHAQQGDAGALATQVREQAAQIGLLEERAAELEYKHARAERDAAERKKILDQLTREEHWRLVCRSAGERGLIVVGPALGDAVVQQLARDMLERAARVLETDAPDNPLVSQRAADACAALVRSLAPSTSTTPEDAARQAEQAAAIVTRFRALFSPPKEE